MGKAHTRHWLDLFLDRIVCWMNPNRRSSTADKSRPSSTTAKLNPRSRGHAAAVGQRVNNSSAVRIEEFRNNPHRPAPLRPPLSKNTRTKIQTMRTTQIKSDTAKPVPTPFAFPSPGAQQVSLAGDFNDWDSQSMPMRKGHDGVWRKSVSLTPGRYEYRFVADGVWQDDPAAIQRIANALGTENCVRTVAG